MTDKLDFEIEDIFKNIIQRKKNIEYTVGSISIESLSEIILLDVINKLKEVCVVIDKQTYALKLALQSVDLLQQRMQQLEKKLMPPQQGGFHG